MGLFDNNIENKNPLPEEAQKLLEFVKGADDIQFLKDNPKTILRLLFEIHTGKKVWDFSTDNNNAHEGNQLLYETTAIFNSIRWFFGFDERDEVRYTMRSVRYTNPKKRSKRNPDFVSWQDNFLDFEYVKYESI